MTHSLGIQNALIKLDTPEATQAATLLDTSLLDNTKLYLEFATPFSLSEWRLSILHSSGHHDPHLVESLWGDLIRSLFDRLNQERDTIGLLRKLNELTVKYLQSGDAYFPAQFIIRLLEQHAFLHKLDQSNLFLCLLDSGVSPLRLLNEYHALYSTKDAFWLDEQAPLYIPRIVLKLSSHLMTSQNVLNTSERRQVVEWLSGHIPIYLTDLQGMNMTLPAVCEMITSFRDLSSFKP